MKTEPTISQAKLTETLQGIYGLSVERLDFWPSAWVSFCYIVHCPTDERYFLKLTRVESFATSLASDPDFYLPLTYDLHTRGILPHIAYPLPGRDGRFIRTVDGYHLILFNYIEGQVVGFGVWPDGILEQLGGLVGKLHRSISQVTSAHPLQECFDLAFEPILLRAFDVLRNVTPADRQGKQDLRDLLLPRQAEILGFLDRLKELRVQAIAIHKPMVFCHADLHGGNLMLDDQGNLHILDWEGAIIAPPERDLFFLADHPDFWQTFLPVYEHEFGPVQLSSAVFGFYIHHRNLEDLADWVLRILDDNSTDEHDADNLNGIIEYSLPGWPYLEKTIQAVEVRLAARHK